MNSKQRRTLERISEHPTRSDISWDDVISLFEGLGAAITQGAGSRVRVDLNGATAVFHEPHPQRQTPKATVRSVRAFLEQAGVRP